MAKPIAQAFQDQGEQIETRNDRPILLSEPGKAWYVTDGSVDCFAVPMRGEEIVGPRRHLVRLEAGSLLLGFPTAGQGEGEFHQIIAVGTGSASLRALGRPQLSAAHRAARDQSELADLVSRWTSALLEFITPQSAATRDVTLVQAGQALTLEAGALARADHGLLWASVPDPSAIEILGDRVGCISSQIVPVSDAAWIGARVRVDVSLVTTAELLAQATDIPGIDAFQQAFIRTLEADWRDSQVAARQRAITRLQSLRAAFLQSSAQLVAILNRRPTGQVFASPQADSLLEACRVVGEYSGIEFKPDAAGSSNAADPVQSIARASQVRYRRVLLRESWWRKDNGALVGILEEGSAPVALLPAPPFHYLMVNPVDGSRVRVDAEVAKRLRPLAIMFYRSFGASALSVMDLLRFGFHGLRSDLLAVVGLGVGGAILGLVPPFVTGIVFDSIIPAAERPQLWQAGAILIVAALGTLSFDLARSVARQRVSGQMGASVQAAVWDRVLALPAPFFRDYAAGDLALRANAVSEIRDLIGTAASAALLTGIFSMFNALLLFYYSPSLAMWSLGIVAVALVATVLCAGVSLKYARKAQQLRGHAAGQILQFISGVSKLRVSGTEAAAFSLWASSFAGQRAQSFKASDITNRLTAFNAALPIVAAMVIYWRVIELMRDHPMPTGEFVAFTAAFVALLQATIFLGETLMSILSVVPLYENAKPILGSRPEVDTGKTYPGELTGHIELSHVAFRYLGKETPLVLRDISITVEPGEFVALVGPSGAGKSTIFRLLLGFETPDAGAILYDQQDLRDLDLVAVRRQLGVVLQNGSLIPADIFTNIAGASSGKTIDDAWEAARLAGIDEDIRRMPLGMFTQVMEGGGAFSGGQKQRLMIARALIHRPRILLMDEATSALDNRTQQLVSESLKALRTTRIVIAHRLTTIAAADRIYVIQDGAVVETGNHDELMARRGVFYDLATRQTV